MTTGKLHLCMGCMAPLEQGGKCKACGYDAEHASLNVNYLAPGFVLDGRYLVGKMTSSDTEGAWYVGYDQQQRERVWVREYAPKAIMMRDYDSGSITPLPNASAQYKALMSDFEDLCKQLRTLSSSEKVIPVLAMVHAHNTVYAIYRYIKMLSLESFLRRSGGALTWRHTKKLLMPLFHTVSSIHKAGLIHRGISPFTVVLDQTGTLWLSCFSIAAARTHKSELSAQLYEGYAAPEQYALNSWQGSWTDVYALGAIAYRAVTGKVPPSAMDRVYGDDLLEQGHLAGDMTPVVMRAINRALAVEVEDRFQSAEELIAGLLANEGSNTAVYAAPSARPVVENAARLEWEEEAVTTPAPSARRSYDRPRETYGAPKEPARSARRREKPKKTRRPHPVLLWMLTAVIATAGLGGGMWWFVNNYLVDLLPGSSQASSARSGESPSANSGSDFTEEEALETESGKTPNFVGATLQSVQANVALGRNYQFVIEQLHNDDYAEGVIFAQQPSAGTESKDGAITLFVSKGAEQVPMPSVVGLPIETAIKDLEAAEIKYQIIRARNPSYDPDVIADCDRQPGDLINLTKDTVILYIKEGDGASDEDEGDKSSSKSSSKKSSSKNSSSKSSSSKSFYYFRSEKS